MIGTPTESLCPHCLRRIAARRTIEESSVYLQKSCPEHGEIEKTRIWNNRRIPLETWSRRRVGANASSPGAPVQPGITTPGEGNPRTGCPFECGICPNHKQHTCSAIVEITHQCNLHCPVCFAASPAGGKPDPEPARLELMFRRIYENAGPCPIQLSGGEPTLRDDLPQIVALARSIGFDHIQVNTNGIRLAQDPGYARRLKNSGVTDFFLQFDGLDNDVYRRIRGAALWASKVDAIKIAAELKIAVILVPTLIKGTNDSQIGAIIQFAKTWMPTVKGVHFQPMTYLGRYPKSPHNDDRMLIPDILTAIEEQMEGELSVENFIPPG